MFNTLKTSLEPPTQKEQAENTVLNNAGGYSYEVTARQQLERFLTLGITGGTFYVSEKDLLKQNLEQIKKLVQDNPEAALATVVEFSSTRRASNNDAAIYVMALLVSLKEKVKIVSKKAGGVEKEIERSTVVSMDAQRYLNSVVRTFTHYSHFITFIKKGKMRGFGTGFQRRLADAVWNGKTVDDIVQSLIKYQNRDGVSQHDLYRLTLPKKFLLNVPRDRANIYDSVLYTGDRKIEAEHPRLQAAKKCLQTDNAAEALELMTNFNLPMESIPTQLRTAQVYEKALETNGMDWLVRNLGNMSALGMTDGFSPVTDKIVNKLTNEEAIRKSGLHPVAVMKALHQYQQGRGNKSDKSWPVNGKIIGALEKAFNLSFKNVEPSGKNVLIAVDVSGSMSGTQIPQIPGMTVHQAAAIMAMAIARKEPQYHCIAFDVAHSSHRYGGRSEVAATKGQVSGTYEIPISANASLKEIETAFGKFGGGGTDCSLPFIYATTNRLMVDLFVCLTDSESWAGARHVMEVFNEYKRKVNPKAKAINVAMVANRVTNLDTRDPNVLEVCGFDSNVPTLISNFAKL